MAPKTDSLDGTVERVTYFNEDNGYSVLRLTPSGRAARAQRDRDGLVTVVGNLFEVAPGEALRLRGAWVTHSQHGLQFKAEHCERVRPASAEGIRRYLASGLIKGVGPVTAKRIVEVFGDETLDVIDHTPERLHEVPGVGPKRIDDILKAWEEQRGIQSVMVFLQGHGVTTRLAVKIYKTYGDQAIHVVEKDPYRLARDIWGIGFLTADRIARSLGLALDAPSRLEAGLVYALNQAVDEGHVFLPRQVLRQRGADLLEAEADLLETAIDRLLLDGACIPGLPDDERSMEGEAIYLAPLYYAETGAAKRLAILFQSPSFWRGMAPAPDQDQEPALDRGEGSIQNETRASGNARVRLSDEQRMAIERAFRFPVSILTGGPGTGKTTALRELVERAMAMGMRVGLAAPTGRAAKRMSEATAQDAFTIHRMLGFKPGEGFRFDEDHPLPFDLLILDETSMLDVLLANQILRAIAPGAHLVLVGDVDQLPSVGPGDVLREIIDSALFPVTFLQTIFRQAEKSLIVRNAHRINQGEFPLTPKDGEDFFLFIKSEPAEAAALLVDIVAHRIPSKFNLDPLKEIQVLAPMHRGALGVEALNSALQQSLNPGANQRAELRMGGRVFRVGDKVMQTRNNYQKEVFNGDIGWVKEVNNSNQEMVVFFDDQRAVSYEFSALDELVHAFAVSVHKSQGSEFPCVVLPVAMAHYVMLQRNLLYTAVTRGRKLVVLVGTKRAIALAVRNDQRSERYSALKRRLLQLLGGEIKAR